MPPASPLASEARLAALEGQITGLGTLLQLAREARRARNPAHLAFVMVNETHRLFRYRQAFLLQWLGTRRLTLVAASGVDHPEPRSPFMEWLLGLLRQVLVVAELHAFQQIVREQLTPAQQQQWREWGDGTLAWCPLGGQDGVGLLFIREDPWSDGERHLLLELADSYGHAWRAMQKPVWRLSLPWPEKWQRLAFIAGVSLLILLPVRLSELAPAQVVARTPRVVTSPLDGVIHQVQVLPNQPVQEGDLLFSLEDTALRNRLEVARKVLAVATAQFQSARQKAFADERSKSELLLLNAKMEEKQAEVAYTEEMLQQSQVKSTQRGIALFEGVDNWLGKPVRVGERVMTISDPEDAEIEIHLAADKGFSPEPHAGVALFLNTDPGHALTGMLRLVGYEAFPGPDNVPAYILRATIQEGQPLPRLGLKGTVRIHGSRVPLIYYLLRRPLTALRQGVGF